ncbi:MAG TPA: 1-hydroxycarotenoid 3,4-desaturase CrtD [Cytophagaceae bacterium]|nr:1-hydroxycarotenoid 3,4-desaturase CrtD [Cytophagaceae bacterium]
MSNKQKTCAIIGSGIAGIGASIRMANKGYKVTVFERNSYPGGKLSSFDNKGYRFDFGPSVFTMPENVEALFRLSGKDMKDYFEYIHLNPGYKYFYEDGTVLSAYHPREKFAEEASKITGESKQTILDYLNYSENIYDLTKEVFLFNSLHKIKNFFTWNAFKGILNFGKIDAMSTMDEVNRKRFKDPRLVQLFNRYATYNGSSPFLAPGTMNVIPHLEINMGIYYPKGGMVSITNSLVKLGKDLGVDYQFENGVEEIIVEGNKAKGVRTQKGTYDFDVVISNMDVYNTYHKLLPNLKRPEKILKQEKSSSAVVFYWGIKKSFPELGLHNILWGTEYRKEFETVVNDKSIYKDPTIYINITSKHTPTDAPPGCENWFTMVNAPHNSGQDWDKLINETRENMIQKISRVLKTDIRPLIECESILSPLVVEQKTSSALGAIYGNASNNRFAAFMRHSNFHNKISNLYFCGGSVHPGPSIPLCLMSAKIATDMIK